MGYEACVVMLCGAIVGVASVALGLVLGYRLSKGAEPRVFIPRVLGAEEEQREEEPEEFAIARR